MFRLRGTFGSRPASLCPSILLLALERLRLPSNQSSESGSSRRRASLFSTSAVDAAAASSSLSYASGNMSRYTEMMLSAWQARSERQ